MANTFFFRPMRCKRQQLSEQECLAILNNATAARLPYLVMVATLIRFPLVLPISMANCFSTPL